jgi:hypothetical protein
MVCLNKASDIFGDCDGVRLRIVQEAGKVNEVVFVDLLMSGQQALNLGSRLIEADRMIQQEETAARCKKILKDVDDFQAGLKSDRQQ